MKTTTKLTTLALLSTLCFATLVKAEDIILPVISKPAILEEGTQRELTPAQIAELLPWAKDSKVFLVDLLDNIQGMNSEDKIERLVDGIKQVVGESAPKNSELLMRYALNRGLVVNDILNAETTADAVGTVDAKIRVLQSSVLMAIKYYDIDMVTLTKKTAAPFVTFGVDYFEFLNELNKSVFDASAQYMIQRTALEWLQWDLYRDLNNAKYAPQIVKINNALKTFPNKKLKDSQSINFIRQMKSVQQQLKMRGTLEKISLDERLANAKNEEERKKILERQAEEARLANLRNAEEQKKLAEAERIKKYGPIESAIQKIDHPNINGVQFSHTANINGVCKSLGYEKAVNGSMVSDDSARGSLLVTNEEGNLIGAVIADSYKGYSIKELICQNKVLGHISQAVEKISNLMIGDKVMISSKSNEDGVCKLLGYEKGVIGSGIGDGSARGGMIIVDKNGNVDKGEVATSNAGYEMSQVICVNKMNVSASVEIKQIENPVFQGNMFSSKSSENGVCKIFGYDHGATGSVMGNADARGSMLVVGNQGDVTGAEIATSNSGYSIAKIICIK